MVAAAVISTLPEFESLLPEIVACRCCGALPKSSKGFGGGVEFLAAALAAKNKRLKIYGYPLGRIRIVGFH